MKRKAFSLLLGILMVTAGLSTRGVVVAQRRYQRRAPAPSFFAARFVKIADDYLRGFYAFNPTEATRLGLHEYDSSLESRSADAVAREIHRLRLVLAELTHVNPSALAPDARLDYLVLSSHARAQLLELEDIRLWQRDPNIYNRLATTSVDNILKRNYAPMAQRLNSVLQREREISRLLNEARRNLINPPRIYTEMAIADTRGSVDYFANVVPQMVERAAGTQLNSTRRAEFEISNNAVVSGLNSFKDWLERDLLPRSTASFALGSENYRRKLLYEEMIDTPIAQLDQAGYKELRQLQENLRDIADEVAPGKGVAVALDSIVRDHPTQDGLVGDTRAELDRIRAFVGSRNLIIPPARENLIVADTPGYERAATFVQIDLPGPFENVASEAYLYLTPGESNWDGGRLDDHLGYFNRYSIPIISMREAIPGLYYQALSLRRSTSRVRSVLGSTGFSEGWAYYCEQMMIEEGFGGNNPALHFAQLRDELLAVCRYLIGIRIHTQNMSFEQAVDFFMREGYLTRTNAEREVRRITVFPTPLASTVGKREILKIREDWKKQNGPPFDLAAFHERLLSYGMPPIKVLRIGMFGGQGGSKDIESSNGSAKIEQDQSTIDFSVVAAGSMSEYVGGRGVELVTTQGDWQRVWRQIGGDRTMPDTNFNTRALVVVRQGQKRTGGYSISVSGIRRIGSTIEVQTDEKSPRSAQLQTQIIMSPFVVVSIARPPPNSEVKFYESVKKANQLAPARKQVYRRRRGYGRHG